MAKIKTAPLLLLIIAIAFFFLLRLPQVLRDQFPFVFDMGRDHIWVRNMVELKKPTLIGPWGSLAGIYFGPAWYYLLSLPYIITAGDPRGSVITVMLLNLTALLIGFQFLKKEISLKSALIFAFIFTLSPLNINITTFPFHANVLPLTQIIMLISMYKFLQGKPKYLWLAALATSLNFHFEPAAAIFTTLTLILFMLFTHLRLKKLTMRQFSHVTIAFMAPFIPQIIFEFRHQFIQIKSLLLYFQGQNQSLAGQLPFFIRIGERIRKFTELFSASVAPNLSLVIAGAMLTVIIIITWRLNKFIKLINFTLLIPLLGFMFLFPPELKGWYLYGFSVNYFILMALFLNKYAKNFVYFLIILVYFIYLGQLSSRLPAVAGSTFQAGPETIKAQKQAIAYIYNQAQGRPFSIYVYTPPIYDYQYQYLFWLKSRQAGFSLPIDYSYLPGKTAYHPQKQFFINQSSQEAELVFLLLEPESDQSRLQGWLGHFAAYPKLWRQNLPSGLTLEARSVK